MNAVSQVQIASVRPALPVRRARASAARAVAGARRSAVSVKVRKLVLYPFSWPSAYR